MRRRLTRGAVALVSVLAVLATGAGWWMAHGVLGGITVSEALSSDDPHSSGGEMNILLIGLDSRKDQDGNELPDAILNRLHAGDSDAGGYNTNTLILVHVGADDKVTAFSIPRDDYVPFSGVPGYNHIKIKEAYGLTKDYAEQKLMNQGVSDQKQLETKGREAGRTATLRAVRNLTGVPIDYFAEVNLAGFYDLAQSLGGVQVCLKHAVYDSYSGADFPAGRQTLNAEQALAFVRQRHGLENGDLDRTHRQQAFLSSVMHQLQSSGTFTDLSKLKSLMAVARKDVVLSAGWDENQFRRMGALAGGDIEYRTLPVVRYANINGQDVNIVDPAAIKAEVAAAFGTSGSSTTTTSTAPNPSTVVDVVNASSTSGLASTVSRTLSQHGYTKGTVRDREYGEPSATTVDYGPGAKSDAQTIAALLGVEAADHSDSSLTADRVQVFVGDDYSGSSHDETSSATAMAGSYHGSRTPSTEPTPDRGAPIDGGGVPCVN
ncbi:transcriptional regulator, LytR family protein [Mycobacterium kyorinense]|uniref:Transcriptional regulator, LytR family protein n=1 Tax=Mycobacterium kyorinense TaxID=487514 RepID=A0A1A2ZIP3_9MYCO|nr:LCP family protein [Mycobacterium kyorinense]OBI49347.1 transcriptional regulator, LytR family protein [Mycobacterium kyorinense]